MLSGLALAPAGANVIMQLSRLPIGHAVAESKVPSGSLSKHPLKRTRTTLGYIVIALFGTDHEREVLRGEVNAQHRQVRSGEGDAVAYDAFDPELQLWVAACMYRGSVDAVSFSARASRRRGARGPLTSLRSVRNDAPSARRRCGQVIESRSTSTGPRRFATSASMTSLASSCSASRRCPSCPRPLARTPRTDCTDSSPIGFLPEPFREELGLEWTPRQQPNFERCTRAARLVNRLSARDRCASSHGTLSRFDTRRRIRTGRVRFSERTRRASRTSVCAVERRSTRA